MAIFTELDQFYSNFRTAVVDQCFPQSTSTASSNSGLTWRTSTSHRYGTVYASFWKDWRNNQGVVGDTICLVELNRTRVHSLAQQYASAMGYTTEAARKSSYVASQTITYRDANGKEPPPALVNQWRDDAVRSITQTDYFEYARQTTPVILLGCIPSELAALGTYCGQLARYVDGGLGSDPSFPVTGTVYTDGRGCLTSAAAVAGARNLVDSDFLQLFDNR